MKTVHLMGDNPKIRRRLCYPIVDLGTPLNGAFAMASGDINAGTVNLYFLHEVFATP